MNDKTYKGIEHRNNIQLEIPLEIVCMLAVS